MLNIFYQGCLPVYSVWVYAGTVPCWQMPASVMLCIGVALYFLFPDILIVLQEDFRIGESVYLNALKLGVRYFAIGGGFVGSFLALQKKK